MNALLIIRHTMRYITSSEDVVVTRIVIEKNYSSSLVVPFRATRITTQKSNDRARLLERSRDF